MALLRSQPTRYLLQRASISQTQAYHPSTLPLPRFLCSTASPRYPRKDTQDRESLNPTSSEYSKSGTDDAAASTDAAFNPNKTSPEEEKASAGREKGQNPLDVSPGNKDVSKPRDPQEGGPTHSPRTSASKEGGAPKAGGNKSG